MIGALLPLVITNIAHMVLVKRNAWSILAKPIHKKAFGANKTWRGVVFISTVNAVLFLLINYPGGVLMSFLNQKQNLVQLLFIGWIFGMAYVLFELPNSFIK
jgi:CDP-diacylglycerol--serine O-phosphatidyltransferase